MQKPDLLKRTTSKLDKNQPNEPLKEKNQSHDFEFYISRYPFPHGAVPFQVKFYRTFYECEGFELAKDKLFRLTSLNRLSSLVKLKEVVKNVTKPRSSPSNESNKVITHSYSLCYEVVPHFILSYQGILIAKSINSKKQLDGLFQGILEDIQSLILLKIYYLLDVQNIGITLIGQVKLYVPANFILEEVLFTEKHEKQMRMTANIVIQSLIRNIENYSYTKGSIDVEVVKQDIKNEMQKIQIVPKNIQSQIFTFNEHLGSVGEKQHYEHNEDLEKTVKIRKSSEKIEFVPALDLHTPVTHLLKLDTARDGSRYQRCVTSRDFHHKQEEIIQNLQNHQINIHCPVTKRQTNEQITCDNPHRQNQLLKQKMKDYQQKLFTLNNTVKQMKQELMTMSKKQKDQNTKKGSKSKEKDQQRQRGRSRTLTNLSKINETYVQETSCMADKLENSRLEIKKLLNDQSQLRYSFHVEDQEEQINLTKEINCLKDRKDSPQKRNNQSPQKRQQSPFKTRQVPLAIETKPKPITNLKLQVKNIDSSQTKKVQSSLKHLKQPSNFIQQHQEASNPDGSKKRQSPQSYDYESSLGKYSPPGGNPFRQYGNFRIEYVNKQDNKSQKQSQKANEHAGGHIQIHPQPIVAPYRIVRSPIKKEHFFYPVVHIRQPFRYSCLAIPKQAKDQYEYIAIPENMYDPTEYDSIDTFQMELGKQCKMPRIVSKDAFRHTLFPSTIVERFSIRMPQNKKSQSKEKSLSGSVKKDVRDNNRIYESAGGASFKKYIQPLINKQHQSSLMDSLSERRSNRKLPQLPLIIRQVPDAFHQVSMELQRQSTIKEDKTFQKGQFDQIQKSRQNIIDSKVSKRIPQHKPQQLLSKTSKDVTKLIRRDFSGDKISQKQMKDMFKQKEKPKINKDKIKAVLNKSKQIISKYKNIYTKKQ